MAFIEGLTGSVAGAEATKPSKGKATSGKGLGAKWHGIPVWGLALGGGLLAYLGYRWYENRNASSASGASTTPISNATGSTGSGFSGGGGGGGTPWWSGLGSTTGATGPVLGGPGSTLQPAVTTTGAIGPAGPAGATGPAGLTNIITTPSGSSSVSTPNPNGAVVATTTPMSYSGATTGTGASVTQVSTPYGNSLFPTGATTVNTPSAGDIAAAAALAAQQVALTAPAPFINSGTAANNAAGTAGTSPAAVKTSTANKAGANPSGVGVHY